jgi:hypothetical protein
MKNTANQAQVKFISPAVRVFSILEKVNGASAHIRIDGALKIGSYFPTVWGRLKVLGNYSETYETARTEPFGV